MNRTFAQLSFLPDDFTGFEVLAGPATFVGEAVEMLADEDKSVASLAASQKVTIQYEEYEAMPHCFAMVAPTLPTAKRLMHSWGDFSRRCLLCVIPT